MGTATNKILSLHRKGKVSKETIIKMAAFKEELEKESAMATGDIIKMLLLGTAFSGGAYATKKGIGVITDILEERKKEPLFQEMLLKHPELRLEDEQKVRDYYDAIWHFAPHMAKNTFASGAYVRQAITMDEAIGGPSIVHAKEMTDIQRLHAQASKDAPDAFSDFITEPLTSSLKAFTVQPKDLGFGRENISEDIGKD